MIKNRNNKDFTKLKESIKNTLLSNFSGEMVNGQVSALCPFHDDEHKGNFSYHVDKGAFNCFSCGAHGNDVLLAKKLNINVDDFINSSSSNKEDIAKFYKEYYQKRGLELPDTSFVVEKNTFYFLSYTTTTNQQVKFQRCIFNSETPFKRISLKNEKAIPLYIPKELSSYSNIDELYIVEGIPDVLTLVANGKYAVGVRSKEDVKKVKDELLELKKKCNIKKLVMIPDTDSFTLWYLVSSSYIDTFVDLRFLTDSKKYDINDYWKSVNFDKDVFNSKLDELKLLGLKEVPIKLTENGVQNGDIIDDIVKELEEKFIFDKIKEKFYSYNLEEYISNESWKDRIDELMFDRVHKEKTITKKRIKIRFEDNKMNYGNGKYSISFGGILPLKNASKFVVVDDVKYILDKKITPYFEFPKELTLNDDDSFDEFKNAILPLLKLVDETRYNNYIDKVAKTLYIWIRNIKLSYYGKMRRDPIFPIISAKHGVGKDKILVKFLLSLIPEKYVSTNGKGNWVSDEREHFRFENLLVTLFSEMEKFEKADVNAIKNFLTNESNNYRVLCTNSNRQFPNITNFIGTSNNEFDKIFTDTTGERRFFLISLLSNVSKDDVENAISKMNIERIFSSVKIDIQNALVDSWIKEIREYQEHEMRVRTIEEEFILSEILPKFQNGDERTIYFDELFKKFYSVVDGKGTLDENCYLFKIRKFDTRQYDKGSFGKKIKPLMLRYSFEHNSNNSYYIYTGVKNKKSDDKNIIKKNDLDIFDDLDDLIRNSKELNTSNNTLKNLYSLLSRLYSRNERVYNSFIRNIEKLKVSFNIYKVSSIKEIKEYVETLTSFRNILEDENDKLLFDEIVDKFSLVE